MRAGIALGSNLGDRYSHLRKAREDVLRLPGVAIPLASSRIYETEPVNSGPDSAAYLNAVIEVEYQGQPITLLDGLQKIEADFGRPSKRPRNAPRTIDLDLLYAGDCELQTENLILPHPRISERRFVLAPLAEIRPRLILPGQTKSVAQMLAELSGGDSAEPLDVTW